MNSPDYCNRRFFRNRFGTRFSLGCLRLQATTFSRTRFLGVWLVALWCCLTLPVSAVALAQGQLEASPNKVELCEGTSRLVTVTATNLGATSAVQLNWSTDTNVIIQAESLPKGVTKDAAASTWLLRLSAPTQGAVSGVIHLYAEGASTAKTDQRLASTSLEVKPPDLSAAFPGTLELDSEFETIYEKQKAVIIALVSNASPAVLQVNRIFLVSNGAPFVAELADPTSLPWVMHPGETRTWIFSLSVPDVGRPPVIGKNRLVFQVDAIATVDGCKRNGSLVAHRDINFDVLGALAILAAFGIQSLIVVPGFLCLLVPSIFWRFNLRPPGKERQDEFPLKPNSHEFWIVGFTLSLLVYLLAPFLTGRPDMFVAYRFKDLFWIWMVSLAVSALVYLSYFLWSRKAAKDDKQKEVERERKLEFAEDDNNKPPINILEKLGRRGESLETMEVEVDLDKAGIGSGKAIAYVLAHTSDGVWISPRIELNTDNLDETTEKAIAAAYEAKSRKGDAEQLANALKKAGSTNKVAFWSKPEGQPHLLGPRQVPNDCVKEKEIAKLIQL